MRKSVREHRIENRYTQKAYADEVGINFHTFVKKERGEAEFTATELGKIKKRFDEIDLNVLSDVIGGNEK